MTRPPSSAVVGLEDADTLTRPLVQRQEAGLAHAPGLLRPAAHFTAREAVTGQELTGVSLVRWGGSRTLALIRAPPSGPGHRMTQQIFLKQWTRGRSAVPGSMSRERVSIWMCRFLAAAEQNSSRTQWTASVMLYGTDLANFILLLMTTLPFLKFRTSRFLKPVRLACRNGISCKHQQRLSLSVGWW